MQTLPGPPTAAAQAQVPETEAGPLSAGSLLEIMVAGGAPRGLAALALAADPQRKAELLLEGISIRTGEDLSQNERATLERAKLKRVRRARRNRDQLAPRHG